MPKNNSEEIMFNKSCQEIMTELNDAENNKTFFTTQNNINKKNNVNQFLPYNTSYNVNHTAELVNTCRGQVNEKQLQIDELSVENKNLRFKMKCQMDDINTHKYKYKTYEIMFNGIMIGIFAISIYSLYVDYVTIKDM
jgi:hypothetical protein